MKQGYIYSTPIFELYAVILEPIGDTKNGIKQPCLGGILSNVLDAAWIQKPIRKAKDIAQINIAIPFTI
jgi:hypothetical protein